MYGNVRNVTKNGVKTRLLCIINVHEYNPFLFKMYLKMKAGTVSSL